MSDHEPKSSVDSQNAFGFTPKRNEFYPKTQRVYPLQQRSIEKPKRTDPQGLTNLEMTLTIPVFLRLALDSEI